MNETKTKGTTQMTEQTRAAWGVGLRSVGLSAVLASAMIGPVAWTAPTASADHADDHDPEMRVMVKVNKIHVLDDEDWGEGEVSYKLEMQRFSPRCDEPNNRCNADTKTYTFAFDADTGDVKELNTLVPPYRAQPNPPVYYLQPEAGLALYPGDSLGISWWGNESDYGPDDWLGSIWERYEQSQSWGLGAHEVRSSGFNTNGFKVEYEIVRAPLPDLAIHDIRVGNFADNGEDIVCVMVENYGQEPVGPYQVNFYVDGVIPRNGHIEESGVLEDIGLRERCFRTTIAAGQHQFVAVVDELHAVPEMNELNNRRSLTATIQREGATRPPMVAEPLSGGALDPGDSSPPMGISTPKLVDLIPTAILVKGKDAQNAGDCHPGRNDVTILVKNQGTLDATQFNVELLIAGEDGSEKLSVSSLSQGAGRDVTFADVKLTKGTHTLTARVDADNNLVESLEVNNKLDAAVTCQA